MRLIPLSDLLIPEGRQRRQIDPKGLEELAESIADVGLLHPPVVTSVNTLVAGERRARAVQYLYDNNRLFSCNGAPVPAEMLPVTDIEPFNSVKLKEAELFENIRREQLTWQERVEAFDEIQRLREMQNPDQTKLETGKEIASSVGVKSETIAQNISRAQVIAPYLNEPEVKNARNEKEAYNAVARRLRREFSAQLEQRTKPSIHTLYESPLEAVDFSKFPPIACTIADPPYGIGAHSFGDAAKQLHFYNDTEEYAWELMCTILEKCWKVGANSAHLYMFHDPVWFPRLKERAELEGWKVWPAPMIWYKGTSAHAPWGTGGMWRSYEAILCCVKGDRPFTALAPDVITKIPNIKQKEHAAQKPAALYRELLARSCRPGETVLDPCCGSGPIFPAATSLKAKAIGIEPEPFYAAIARDNLSKEYV